MKEVNIYISVDKSTPKAVPRGYAYLLEYFRKDGNPETRFGTGTGTLTLHQAALQAMIEATGRLNCECWLHIHADDLFVLNMIKNNLPKWAYENFETKKLANKELWQKLWVNIRYQKIDLIPGEHSYDAWLKRQLFIGSSSKTQHFNA